MEDIKYQPAAAEEPPVYNETTIGISGISKLVFSTYVYA